jgi:hypothetical protein
VSQDRQDIDMQEGEKEYQSSVQLCVQQRIERNALGALGRFELRVDIVSSLSTNHIST